MRPGYGLLLQHRDLLHAHLDSASLHLGVGLRPIHLNVLVPASECKHSAPAQVHSSEHDLAYSILSLMYTMVSIQNTYVWIAPVNTSQ